MKTDFSSCIHKKTVLAFLIIFSVHFCFLLSSCYAQSPNTWTQRANFPGSPRTSAVAFTIGTKGYIGTGIDSNATLLKDFWEYDPAADQWMQLADFGGTARRGAVGFSMNAKGYIGTGFDGTNNLLDFWEYDPSGNSWTPIKNLGNVNSTPRREGVAFTIPGKAYVVTGYDGTVDLTRETWEFDGDSTWIKRADLGNGSSTQSVARRWALALAIDSAGYVGCGFDYSVTWKNDFWRYNVLANNWTQLASFSGSPRSSPVGFVLNGKAFVGTGNNQQYESDFWQYNPQANAWVRIADFSGGAVTSGIAFSAAGRGFAGLGRDSVFFRTDFWEYTPDSTIGIEEDGVDQTMHLFPNPCRDLLNIQFQAKSYNIKKADVYNSCGVKFSAPLTVSANTIHLKTDHLQPGIYYLVVGNEKNKVVRKFIKY